MLVPDNLDVITTFLSGTPRRELPLSGRPQMSSSGRLPSPLWPLWLPILPLRGPKTYAVCHGCGLLKFDARASVATLSFEFTPCDLLLAQPHCTTSGKVVSVDLRQCHPRRFSLGAETNLGDLPRAALRALQLPWRTLGGRRVGVAGA